MEIDRDTLQKLALLKAAAENMPDAPKEDDGLFLMSVKEAEQWPKWRAGRISGRIYADVAEYVVDPAHHVYGSPDDYFNFTVDYLRAGDYYSTLKLCDYALQRFPYSVDLLANAIQAAGDCGDFVKSRHYLETAKQIDKRYWNWRLFHSTIEMYQNQLTQASPDTTEALFAEALDMTHLFQKTIPLDERAYNKEAELYLFANEMDKAREILRKAIFDPVQLPGGESQSLIAPQCCVTMLNDVLDIRDDYEQIIQIAQKGIQFTTQKQPSSRIGYFIYRSALAKDALIVRSDFRNKQDIQEALREYQCAYDLNQDNPEYAGTIAQRYAILSQNAKNPVTDIPLVKRSLTISKSEGE